MSRLAALYEEGFIELQKAVDAEAKQQLEEAVEHYERGLTAFRNVLELEPSAKSRAVVESKLAEETKRLFQHKKTLADEYFGIAMTREEEGHGSEAVDAYQAAITFYLGSIKLQEDDVNARPLSPGGEDAALLTKLKRRVAEILDHLEVLRGDARPRRQSTSESVGGRNPSCRESGNDRASSDPHATGSAGGSRSSSDNPVKQITALDLPLPPDTPIGTPPAAAASQPQQLRQAPRDGSLTPEEIEVLKRSSVINGRVFLPWLPGEELQEKFHYGTTKFTDPEGLLPLSAKQSERLAGWKRPSEIISGEIRMIKSISPFTIEQELVTDCSFVASLCISAEYERRFKRQLITRIIFPQDKSGRPVYNPSGKYVVKLWACGVVRKVIVDDLLPVDSRNRLLCSCSKDRSELWVAIIEKAYMKLHGGYTFPGSNSCIDLYALTGWIPESIHFEEDDPEKRSNRQNSRSSALVLDHRQPAERAWQRLLSASRLGDCLITVATSDMPDEEAERLGLVPTHAYAVLDVREVGALRFLLVKNPWAHKRWTGAYSVTDTERWTTELQRALGYDPIMAQRSDDGVFWVDWPSIRRYFNTVSLNWNTDLFQYRNSFHATWPVTQGPKNDFYTVGANPQYCLRTIKDGPRQSKSVPTVWLLLSRHVLNTESALQGGDFLTCHVYRSPDASRPRRIFYPSDDVFVRGVYSNSPHNLTRFDVADDDNGSYVVVLSQYEKVRDVSYSLTILSTAPFSIGPAPSLPETLTTLDGVWETWSAGGRLGLPSFYTNPQFSVAVNRKTAMHIELYAPKDIYISISVIQGPRGGRRVDSILHGEEVMSSGAFRQGFAYCDAPSVEPGLYTVVVSTYEPGQRATFMFKIWSRGALQHARPLLPEGDRMHKQIINGEWSEADGTLGGAGGASYARNPTYVLICSETSKLTMRLQCPQNEPLNLSVYSPGPDGRLPAQVAPTSPQTLASSCQGIYTACRCGVAIPQLEVAAGRYLIVPSAYDARAAAYSLTIYSLPKPVEVKMLE